VVNDAEDPSMPFIHVKNGRPILLEAYMRVFLSVIGIVLALTTNSTYAQEKITEWHVAPEVGSFSPVITVELSSAPVFVYRVCHIRGSAKGLAVRINCAPDGRIEPDPTKGCFERLVVANACQDFGSRSSIAIRRYSSGSEEDVGTFGLVAVR
jgi:hypothetical protein